MPACDDEGSEDAGDVDLEEGLEPARFVSVRFIFGWVVVKGSSGPAAAPRSAMATCSAGTCHVAFCKTTLDGFSYQYGRSKGIER